MVFLLHSPIWCHYPSGERKPAGHEVTVFATLDLAKRRKPQVTKWSERDDYHGMGTWYSEEPDHWWVITEQPIVYHHRDTVPLDDETGRIVKEDTPA